MGENATPYRFIAPVELHEKNPSKEAGSVPPTLHSLVVLPLVLHIPHSKVLESFVLSRFDILLSPVQTV